MIKYSLKCPYTIIPFKQRRAKYNQIAKYGGVPMREIKSKNTQLADLNLNLYKK